jgi:hypothetical protein
VNCVGGMCIALGQYVYDNFEVWRKHKAIEVHYPDLFPDHVHKWSWVSIKHLTNCSLQQDLYNWGCSKCPGKFMSEVILYIIYAFGTNIKCPD